MHSAMNESYAVAVREAAEKSLCRLLVEGAPRLRPTPGATSECSSSNHAAVGEITNIPKPDCSLSTLIHEWTDECEHSLRGLIGKNWDTLTAIEKHNCCERYFDNVPKHLRQPARSFLHCVNEEGTRKYQSETDVQTAVYDLVLDLFKILQIDKNKIEVVQNAHLRKEGVPDIYLVNSAWRLMGFVEVKKTASHKAPQTRIHFVA